MAEREDSIYSFGKRKIASVCWLRNPDGPGLLCSGSWDSQEQKEEIELWEFTAPDREGAIEDPVRLFGSPHEGDVTDMKVVSFSRHSDVLAASSNGSVGLYRIGGEHRDEYVIERVAGPFSLHKAPCTSLDTQKEDAECVSGGEDGMIHFFRLPDGKPHTSCGAGDAASIRSVRFCHSNVVIAGGGGSVLRLWDARSPKSPQKRMQDTAGVMTHCLCPHPQQQHIVASGASDGNVTMWDLRKEKWPVSRTHAHQGDGEFVQNQKSKGRTVWDLQFHPTRTDHVVSVGEDGQMLLFDFNASQQLTRTAFDARNGPDNLSVSLLLSSDLSLNCIDIDSRRNVAVAGSDMYALTFRTKILQRI